jgi:hypothetical protein
MAVMTEPMIELRPAGPAGLWFVQWRGLGRPVTAVFGTGEAEQRAFVPEHPDAAA